MTTFTMTAIEADEGKALREKATGNLSKSVILPPGRSIDEFEEIDYEEPPMPEPPPPEDDDEVQ